MLQSNQSFATVAPDEILSALHAFLDALSYRILEVDAGDAHGPIALAAGETGVALVMRRGTHPVGFAMVEAAPGATISARAIERAVAAECADTILRSAIRDSLAPIDPTAPLPTLTLAICTKDRPDLLVRCLHSIARVRDASPHRETLVEVLVIDNAPSDDRTARVVAATGWARRCLDPRAGLDFARNTAWREARGDYVAYVDDDAVIDAGWLEGFAAACRRHPDAGAFTGLVLPLALETEAQIQFERRGGFRRGFASRRYAGEALDGNVCFPAGAGSFGAGCNMIIRRDLLARIGGFDEALDTGRPLPGGGDLDIFYRVIRSGMPLVYEPGILVFHEHRRTMEGLRRQYYTWGLGFFAFLVKTWRTDRGQRGKLVKLSFWWAADQLRTATRAVLGRGSSRLDHTVAEMWGAVVGLFGAYGRSTRRSARIRAAHQR